MSRQWSQLAVVPACSLQLLKEHLYAACCSCDCDSPARTVIKTLKQFYAHPSELITVTHKGRHLRSHHTSFALDTLTSPQCSAAGIIRQEACNVPCHGPHLLHCASLSIRLGRSHRVCHSMLLWCHSKKKRLNTWQGPSWLSVHAKCRSQHHSTAPHQKIKRHGKAIKNWIINCESQESNFTLDARMPGILTLVSSVPSRSCFPPFSTSAGPA